MDLTELVGKISEIIFAVPDELYKFSKPDYCFDIEWRESSPKEKAYLLIQALLINLNKEKIEETNNTTIDIQEMSLGKGPTFFNQADENMFFKAIYSMPSYVRVKGSGADLYLYYANPMSKEEKVFLEGLLKRYSMSIPSGLRSS